MPPAAQTTAAPVVRAASADDVQVIADIWHEGWRDAHLGHVPEALHQYRRRVDFRHRVPARLGRTTVAVLGGRVVGFVTVRGDEVEQLYVAAEARGGLTARALLGHAESDIGRRHERAWLAVVVGNSRARRFYARQGWREVGAFDYAAETADGTLPVPCLRYEKRLSDGARS